MPELPEVETIRSQLTEILPFEVKSATHTKELKQNVLHTKLALDGLTLTEARRKGKMLDFIQTTNMLTSSSKAKRLLALAI
jgi:formamidopyrimidine-DNA glycosylase